MKTRSLAALVGCRPRMRVVGLLLLALSMFQADPAHAQMRGPGGMRAAGPTEVGVMSVTREDVPYFVTLPGRAVAWQSADIRPRVSGVVSEIAYEPGRPIKAGEVMFRIEDDTYRANLQVAEAATRKAEASVATAQSALDRVQSLLGKSATQASVEAAELSLAEAEASLSTARAQEQIASLDLQHTELRSPIDGIADISEIAIGALVTANQGDALTTVRRIDPIYVDVTQSSAAILRTRDRIRASELAPGEALDVRLTLEDGQIYEGEGKLISRGNAVSTTTGTTTMRFEFDNPEHLILPGQFLRVQVTLGTMRGVLVPQRATSRSADGQLTAFIAEDGQARQIILTEAGTWQNAWIITEGIQPGDRVIIDGLQNLRDGAEITTVPVQLSEDGVVIETSAGGSAPAPERG